MKYTHKIEQYIPCFKVRIEKKGTQEARKHSTVVILPLTPLNSYRNFHGKSLGVFLQMGQVGWKIFTEPVWSFV